MRKPFFKAVVAGMASVAMIAGMSACGRSANNADSDSDAVKTIDSSKATGDLTIWAMGNEGVLSARQTPDRHRRGQRSRRCADGHHLDGRFLQLVLHRA